jgi:hypothetical protein
VHESPLLLARILRGIEWIASAEVRSRLGITDIELVTASFGSLFPR